MMVEILLLLIVVLLALAVGFLIPVLIELRRTAREATNFLKTVGGPLRTTLAETEGTIKNLRGITGDINTVTKEARGVSVALLDVAENIKGIGKAADEMAMRVSGLRAGFKAAFEVMIRNIFKKGGI